MKDTIEIYKGASPHGFGTAYYWRIRAANGNILVRSQGYKRKQSASVSAYNFAKRHKPSSFRIKHIKGI